jgi:ATP-dependent Zn protease
MVRNMMDSGLTSLGIIDREMVTKDQLMKENTIILDALMIRTKELLEQQRSVFEHSFAILMKEEVLSGDTFRNLFDASVSKSA